MLRRPATFLVSIAILIAGVVGAFSAPAGARAAVDLRVCGVVSVYVPATVLLPGTLVVGPTALVIAAGTDLSSAVAVGENLCFSLDLDASGRITDATVTINVTSSLDLCGLINAYVEADADSAGSLRIGSRVLVLAAGSSLPASVDVGANLCLHLTLNGFGEVSGGTAQANVTSSAEICGVVTAFADATATTAGSIAIGGRSFVIAPGANLPASVAEDANLCMTLTLNALGQISSAGAQANVTTTLEVCGQVTAVTAATATSDGSLTMGGVTRPVAAGTALSSAIDARAYVRLRLTIDVFGRIADDVVLDAGATLAEVCGSASTPAPSPTAAPTGTPDPSAGPDPSDTAQPSGSPDPSAGPSGSAGPSPSGIPGAGGSSPTASPSGDGSGSGGPGGSGSGDAGSPADGCTDDGTAGLAGGSGGILPDTASLGRAGRVLGLTAIPLLLMLLGLIGWALWQRRGSAAAGRGVEQ